MITFPPRAPVSLWLLHLITRLKHFHLLCRFVIGHFGSGYTGVCRLFIGKRKFQTVLLALVLLTQTKCAT